MSELTFNVGWPEALMIILILLHLISVAVMDGQERKNEKYNFPMALVGRIILVILLVWGGFFA